MYSRKIYDPKEEHARLMLKKRELVKRLKDPKTQQHLKEEHEKWGEQ